MVCVHHPLSWPEVCLLGGLKACHAANQNQLSHLLIIFHCILVCFYLKACAWVGIMPVGDVFLVL